MTLETRPTARGTQWRGTALRGLVSVVLLGFIMSRLDLAAVGNAIATLDWAWMFAAVGVVYAAVALSAVKWGVLLRARGFTIGFWRLVRHYMVGFFFNNFLPTSVGGDVVRAWDVGRDAGDAPEGAASVITERLIASVGLALTALLGLPFVPIDTQTAAAVGVVFVVGVGLAGLFMIPSLGERLVGSSMGGRFEHVGGWVGRATSAVGATLRRPSVTLGVLALSVGFQVLVAAVNWCIFRALGAPLPLAECVVYTSIVSAVTMVPVSISGHGVREAGYAYFFGIAGVPESQAVVASLLFFAVVAVSTAPGAVLFALGRRSGS